MKKIVTLLLLALFLFNVMGYYGVYLGLRYQSSRELKASLDANTYDESEMLTIKVPYLLPYQAQSTDFERVDGDFEKSGEFYTLVKQKVERDTLFIVYVKNHRETSLFKFVTGFVQCNADAPASKTALKLIESFVKDYISCIASIQPATAGWSRDSGFAADRQKAVLKRDAPVFSPPPNVI